MFFENNQHWPDRDWPDWKKKLWQIHQVWKKVRGWIFWALVAMVLTILGALIAILISGLVASWNHHAKPAGLSFTLTPGEQVVGYALTWTGVHAVPIVTYNRDGTLTYGDLCEPFATAIKCEGVTYLTRLGSPEVNGQPITFRSEAGIGTRASQ